MATGIVTLAGYKSQHESKGAQSFINVTLYTVGGFGAHRIDCRELIVRKHVKFAQYDNAIEIAYVQKGKRNPRKMTLTYQPYALIVDTKHAIKPGTVMKSEGSGMVSALMYDPAHQAQWDGESAGMPVLMRIDYRQPDTLK